MAQAGKESVLGCKQRKLARLGSLFPYVQKRADALVRELHETLAPVGAVELAFVERVSAAIWRQRRLMAAETAALQLDLREGAVVKTLGRLRDPHVGYDPPASLVEPVDEDLVSWCKAALEEYARLDAFDLETIKRQAPHIVA
jgi:hypothetical protein